MPVGGIACGQLYLGGDGRLWYWDIFTSTTTTDYEAKIWAGPHYEHPLNPKPVVEQGFAIRVKQGEKTIVRALDRRGFKDITFRGEYPIGRVSYRDDGTPARSEPGSLFPVHSFECGRLFIARDDSLIPGEEHQRRSSRGEPGGLARERGMPDR